MNSLVNSYQPIKRSTFASFICICFLTSIFIVSSAPANALDPLDVDSFSVETATPDIRPLFDTGILELYEISKFLGYTDKVRFKIVEQVQNYDMVTFLGDSIMLSAIGEAYPINQNAFEDMMGNYTRTLVIDTEIGRQLTNSNEIVEDLSEKGKLGEVLVIGLGTNGAWELEKSIEDLIMAANKHSVSQILFINTRCPSTPSSVNRELKKAEERHDNVELIDWNKTSSSTDSYFSDECHVQYRSTSLSLGVVAYQSLIDNWFSEQKEKVLKVDEQMTLLDKTNSHIRRSVRMGIFFY